MSLYRAGVSAVLALLPVCASATTVELVFDVNVTTRFVGEVNVAFGPRWKSDLAFLPQSFAVTARFDLEDPAVRPNGIADLFAVTTFSGGGGASLTQTPYTAGMRAGIASVSDETHAYFTQAVLISNLPPTPTPVGTATSAGFSASSFVETIGDVGVVRQYFRGIYLGENSGDVLTAENFHDLAGTEFVSWLQARTGPAYTARFTEQYEHRVAGLALYEGQWLTSFAPEDLISYEGVRLAGNATLRSVSVVPEPSSALLMLLGLAVAGTAAARGRR